MSLNRIFKLPNGQPISALGLGTWRSKPDEMKAVLAHALTVGYRHLDCAYVYENEAEIGETLKALENHHPRSSLFITSKLWNTFHEPDQVILGLQKTLKDLQTDYLDLYLMHWPIAHVNDGTGNSVKDPSTNFSKLNENVTIEETWKAMEKLVDLHLVKSIGVSNFSIKNLERILKIATIKPAMNQVELHPYLPQNELVEFCKRNGILVTAYSPLGSAPGEGKILSDPTVAEIAKKNKVSPAQVLISWSIQRGVIVIPKSSNLERLEQNFHDIVLPLEDFETLNQLHKTVGTSRYVDPKTFWGVEIFN